MNARAMSLVELLIASVLMLITIGGIATLMQRAAGIATSQRGGIDLQQNRRGAEREITRSLLLAGRGGLPAGRALPKPAPPTPPPHRLPDGIALRVENNVGSGRRILPGVDNAPRVALGTDILTVRAVTGSLYRLGKNALSRTSSTSVNGRLVVPRTAAQDLEDLEEALAKNKPLALVIGSAADADAYGVAELDPAASQVQSDQIVLAFVFYEPGNVNSEPGRPAQTYSQLGPEGLFPIELFRQGAATVGILRELRYYVRHQETSEVPVGEDGSDRLSRAEVFPGLERAADDDSANLAQDIAYGVVDLQISLGFDTPALGTLATGGSITSSADGKNDDWLWNAPSEKENEAPWKDLSPWSLEEVEVSLLARSPFPDRTQIAPPIDHLGDRPGTELNTDAARRYRRSLTSWRIQLRNL